MDRVQQQIMEQLTCMEREHGVTIPIAVESGSRAWGFASADSDYDCRFIYVHPRDWYLSVFPGKDTIDYRPDAVFDVGGWDVRKVIQHLLKSNAVMLEWLCSGVVYRMDQKVHNELWRLGEAFFHLPAVCWHYLSMARNKLAEIQSSEAAKMKQYCYVLRPLACIRFIQTHGRIPYMEYRRNLAEIPVEEVVLEQIHLLLERKATATEGQCIPPNPVLLDYFERECAWAAEWIGGLRCEKNRDYAVADTVFRSIVEEMSAHGRG